MVNSLNRADCINHSQFLDSIQTISKKFFYNFKPYNIFPAIFTSYDVKQLKSLSTDTSVIISKPDTGRAVVLVYREKYVASMSSIISDVDKFTEIKEPIHKFTLRVEDKMNYFLKKIKDLNLLSQQSFDNLCVSGSSPGILYGLPKIHKPDFCHKFQFRPIFSACNTPSFKLAKFLVPPLTRNQYTVDNSSEFACKLKEFSNAGSYTS